MGMGAEVNDVYIRNTVSCVKAVCIFQQNWTHSTQRVFGMWKSSDVTVADQKRVISKHVNTRNCEISVAIRLGV